MYNKEIIISSETNGYDCFVDKDHPLAYPTGMVYLHRHTASIKSGRWLNSNEHVHHIDGNKKNNDLDNLEIISNSDHTKLHHEDRMNSTYGEGNWDYKKEVNCLNCKSRFKQNSPDQIYCSKKCSELDHRKIERPLKKELEELINNNSWSAIGRMYGVSDNAVRKWAKSYGIKIKSRQKKLGKTTCPACGKTFKQKSDEQIYCSNLCATRTQRKLERPSKEKLLSMRKTMTQKEIADIYEVSTNSIHKWLKYYKKYDS